MIRKLMITITIAALALGTACSKRVLVKVPPRVDLYGYEAIGMVEFTCDAEGTLASFATQRFIQALQEAQPGIRILELGKASEIAAALGSERLDHAAIRKLGEQYNVDAVIVGDLTVSDMRPNVNVYNMLKTMSVSAEVDASLTTRLLETGRGATIWTNSTSGTKTVAHAGVTSSGGMIFDSSDPESAYGELVDALVNSATGDFRVTYARQ